MNTRAALPFVAGVCLHPGDWDELFIRSRFVVLLHTDENLTQDDRLGIPFECRDAVNVGRAPDVFDAFEDCMAFHSFGGETPSALNLMIAVVADPGFAENLPAEAPLGLFTVVVIFRVGLARLEIERMRRGAQAEDWFARVDVILDILHLVVGEVCASG